jgi:hypothetical protein
MIMAATPVEPDLGPHTGGSQSGLTSIVPQYREPDDTDASLADDPPPGRRFPVVGLLLVVALAAIVALVTVTFARFLEPPDRDARTAATPAPPAFPHAVSGPLGTTQAAEFRLVAGVTAVVVRAADLGTDLFRASTPAESGFVPRVEREGDQVRLRAVSVGDIAGADTVTMELNQRVKWRIVLDGGSESASVDLRSATVAGVDFAGGVARIELWLPKPQGEVTVRMSGGARDFTVHSPGGVPVRVTLARGASKVTVDGVTRSGLVDGTQLVPNGWNGARDRYDLDAVAGLANLTVGR